ncbi:unnamed protein product, partial [Thelazia callipaeda]|uniref:FMRFamide-related neuropeptides n=1 Tax=Thelazia callipaeda TaxID=103827 RepID=A0A0N5D545_THECL
GHGKASDQCTGISRTKCGVDTARVYSYQKLNISGQMISFLGRGGPNPNFMRFVNEPNFLRFGRRQIGKFNQEYSDEFKREDRKPNFLRFGK